MTISTTRLGLAAAAISTFATPALAHHPLAGAPMETLAHGVLSGIGHPILGFDHLFFVVAVGIAAAFTGRALVAPLGYVAAMAAGVLLWVGGVALPAVELVIASSLAIVGGIVLSGRALGFGRAVVLFGALGLFHGWALGGAMAAQESVSAAVLTGYLAGLAVTQWAIAVAAGKLVTMLWGASAASDIRTRLAGAAIAGVGGFLVLEQVDGAVFSALGLA